eukprot:gene10759-22479_t
MSDLNPIILIAGACTILALVLIVVFLLTSSNAKSRHGKSNKKKKAQSDDQSKGTNSKPKAKTNNASVSNAKAKEASGNKNVKVTKEVPVPAAPAPVAAVVEPIAPGTKPKKAKETPEQKAARLERQKISKQKKATIAKESPVPVEGEVSKPVAAQAAAPRPAPPADGWAVVEKVKVKKVKEAPKKAEAADGVKSDSTKTQISIEAKKIGMIIGPKGATMRSIQELTNVEITMPAAATKTTTGPALIAISGPLEGVAKATQIINDLCNKGYSGLLAGEDFQESSVSVHPMYLPEIIGKNGICIRSIQDQLEVRMNVPQGIGRDQTTKVKIGIAGPKDKVALAKNVIHEIEQFYHSNITHPGVTHAEIDVPDRMFNYIIGPKGSEIRHIENNFKVSVYIPNSDSLNKAVVVVGAPACVEGGERYIRKIIAQAGTDESAASETMQGWTDVTDAGVEAAADEPWMGEYMYDRNKKTAENKTTVSEGVTASAPAAAAWGGVSSAEG